MSLRITEQMHSLAFIFLTRTHSAGLLLGSTLPEDKINGAARLCQTQIWSKCKLLKCIFKVSFFKWVNVHNPEPPRVFSWTLVYSKWTGSYIGHFSTQVLKAFHSKYWISHLPKHFLLFLTAFRLTFTFR